MQKLEALCPAKINLTFDIKGRLEDGYHEVETLYQAVSIYDQLVFECYLGKPFDVKINVEGSVPKQFPLGQDNIIYKAANRFHQSLPAAASFALQVAIKKNIPIGAGLGGASSNAAATLMALNTMLDKPCNAEKLTAIAGEVGADVAFFIDGGLALGTSHGEKLQQLKTLPDHWLVLVKPNKISVQTSWAYECFDKYVIANGTAQLPKPNWYAATDKLQADKLGNVFEPAIFEHYPVLADLKNAVESAGATCCHMTGSGSSLYGLADSEEHAKNIADKLRNETIGVDIFVTRAIGHGVQLGETGEAKEENQKANQHAI